MAAPTNIQILERKLIDGNLSMQDLRLLVSSIIDVSKGKGYDGGAIPGSGGGGGGAVDSVNGQIGVVELEASHIPNTPQGSITATDVQAAVDQLNSAIELTTKVLVTGAVTLDSTSFGKVHVCSGTSVDYTIELPSAVGNEGKMIAFKGDPLSSSLNKTITIDANGTELIDRFTTLTISTGGYLTLIARVTGGIGNWDVISFDQGATISYTPTVTGFASTPSTTAHYRRLGLYTLQLFLNVPLTTSNASTFTFTLPFAPSFGYKGIIPQVADNSVYKTSPGVFIVTGGSAIVDARAGSPETVWTGSGTKGILGQLLFFAL